MRDDTHWLGARLFGRPDVDPPITPPSEIRNAATLKHAASGAWGTAREDVREAFRARREARETLVSNEVPDENAQARRLDVLRAAIARGDDAEQIRAAWPTWWALGASTKTERQWHRDLAMVRAGQGATPAQEPKMPRGQTDTNRTARREALRAYLAEHGPTKREVLREALGYGHDGAGRQRLNADINAIGAVGESRNGPVALRDATPAPKSIAGAIARVRSVADLDAPPIVRPSLAVAAREALREANAAGGELRLDPVFVAALHGMLVEAGL